MAEKKPFLRVNVINLELDYGGNLTKLPCNMQTFVTLRSICLVIYGRVYDTDDQKVEAILPYNLLFNEPAVDCPWLLAWPLLLKRLQTAEWWFTQASSTAFAPVLWALLLAPGDPLLLHFYSTFSLELHLALAAPVLAHCSYVASGTVLCTSAWSLLTTRL